MENDLRSIQDLCRKLYASISFSATDPPVWDRMRGLFHANGQLIRNLTGGPEVFTVETFIQWIEKSRRDGLASFFEEETDHSTHVMGGLAHRASHYRSTVGGTGQIEGVNSIQLMKCEGEWKILSLAWEVPQ